MCNAKLQQEARCRFWDIVCNTGFSSINKRGYQPVRPPARFVEPVCAPTRTRGRLHVEGKTKCTDQFVCQASATTCKERSPFERKWLWGKGEWEDQAQDLNNHKKRECLNEEWLPELGGRPWRKCIFCRPPPGSKTLIFHAHRVKAKRVPIH